MEATSESKPKRYTCIGILAHVDAGKTTLSEGLLYESGSIRSMGRVDNKDAFLDTHEIERNRGITIFSKQAVFRFGEMEITLLDTPGHVDFSAEMERTLQVLDYAVLVISGADGVQGHTQTLWSLLEKYKIPTFLFINKMDQPGTDKQWILTELKNRLDEGCVDFSRECGEDFYEDIAVCDEGLLNTYLDSGRIGSRDIAEIIAERRVFPCYFGSALKADGVREFLQGIGSYTRPVDYPEEFGAKVFKISRDEQGSRLTHLKVTGGVLKVRSALIQKPKEEKVSQIRIYSGEKYQTAEEAQAGMICAVTGLADTRPGDGFGIEDTGYEPALEPVLTYQVILPEGVSAGVMLPKLRQLQEEEPELHIVWNEQLQEIQVQIMGEVQLEILKSLIAERFDTEVEFGTGNIVYKETIKNTVEGVGHFEPLRHYAEVHLFMEPLEPGSGLQFDTQCSEDMLDKNWQRLILTHLQEREHSGVLTGSAITDMKITLAAGRAHLKHTEGGDFRQATYRAVRQGLKQAESVLLEPYYEFRLEVPQQMVGRAMSDIERMYGEFENPQTEGEMSVLTGSAPVSEMNGYQREVIAYAKGRGRLFCALNGYRPCHNADEVIENTGYDSERDTDNPTGSVFCSHGAGFTVSWDKVKDYMHVDSQLTDNEKETEEENAVRRSYTEEEWIDTEEIDRILEQTYFANRKKKTGWAKKKLERTIDDYKSSAFRASVKKKPGEKYLLVDGYNIIFAWEELKELAEASIDGARTKLMDILCNYQGYRKCTVILVFDAYRVEGHACEVSRYHNIHVVYTKEAETADQYIEKTVHEIGKRYQVTVATSDRIEQVIIMGQGARRLSARDFREEVMLAQRQIRENLGEQKEGKRYFLGELAPELTGAGKRGEEKDGAQHTDDRS